MVTTDERGDIEPDAALQTAIELEKTGAILYEALADVLSDPGAVRLCRDLEAAERRHERTFKRLRSDLARRGETVLLSEARIAETRELLRREVVPPKSEIRRVVSSGKIADLLALAAELERKSIAYYVQLRERTDIAGARTIDALIREEEQHLVDLGTLAV